MASKKVNISDVVSWLRIQVTFIPLMIGVFTIGGSFLWYVYAEPAVREVVEDSTKDTRKKVEVLETKMEHIHFENKQQLYLLKKLAGKQAVKDMEEETEIFKPAGYEAEGR